jgi:hypothetical protein
MERGDGEREEAGGTEGGEGKLRGKGEEEEAKSATTKRSPRA